MRTEFNTGDEPDICSRGRGPGSVHVCACASLSTRLGSFLQREMQGGLRGKEGPPTH